ncbi:MAG: PTS sugar transporter subunit IIC [Endomicrobiia bacterium]
MELIIWLSVIGAICSADITAFGQFMISRPIFCGPLFGYILGDINTGLWLGLIIEMMWINAIPMGVSVPVDLTMMTILSVVWACTSYQGSQEAAIFALALAIPFAYLYSEIDKGGRLFNTKIMHWIERGIEQGKEYRITQGIFFGLFLFLLRASIAYFLFFLIGGIIFKQVYSFLPYEVIYGLKKAWYYLPVFGFGAVMYNFRNIKIPFLKK